MALYQEIPNSYQIAHLTVRPNIVLAPMVGVTDSVFRRLLRSLGGLGLVTTEMTNAASVSPKAMKRHRLLEFLPEERPLAMQLSGNDPELIAEAARQCEALGADIIDINCGCPSPKVTGGGHGSALLRDLPKMGRLLSAVRSAVSVPLTLKFRAGWDDDSLNYLDTARLAESLGVNALALHPRTKAQGYAGTADWSRVAEVKRVVGIPVLGSGDVKSAQDALDRLAATGVDGVMIGRGAMSNPWIFQQAEQLRAGMPMFEPAPLHKRDFLLLYMDMLLEFMPPHHASGKIKQLIGQFYVGLPGAAQLRRDLQRAPSIDAQRTIIESYFEGIEAGDGAIGVLDEAPEEMEDALVES